MALSAKGKPLSLDAAIIKRPKVTAVVIFYLELKDIEK